MSESKLTRAEDKQIVDYWYARATGHYQQVQQPGDGGMSPREASKIARAFLTGSVELEVARPALERLVLLGEVLPGRRACVPKPQLTHPSTLGTEAVRKLRAGQGAELLPADVVGVYLFAYAGNFGREDPEFVGNQRIYTTARARALVLVRKHFDGVVEPAARYAARAVVFWKARSAAARWPGPQPARWDALCDDRLLNCWRSGEIDREVKR